jgi:hypothetical protein
MLKDIESALFLAQVYLKLYLSNEDFIHKEIKSRLHTVHLLFKMRHCQEYW